MRKLISSRASERFRRPKRGGENLISWLALVATVVFLLGVSQNQNTHAPHESDRQQSVQERERERVTTFCTSGRRGRNDWIVRV